MAGDIVSKSAGKLLEFNRVLSVFLLIIIGQCSGTFWVVLGGFIGVEVSGSQIFEGVSRHSLEYTVQPFLVKPDGIGLSRPVEPICDALVDNFTEATNNYTQCVIQNARAFRLCQSCIVEYLQASKSYRLLVNKPQNSSSESCTEGENGIGEVGVFRKVFDFVEQMWQDNGCQNCFAWYEINSTLGNELSKATKQFLLHASNLFGCIFNDSVFNDSAVLQSKVNMHHKLLTGSSGNLSNETICVTCLKQYKDMNNFYVANFESVFENQSSICADISDLMNFTRHLWNEKLKCPIVRASIWQMVLTSVLLCCLPIAFYIASKVCGSEVEETIVQQKRLRRRSGMSSVGNASTSSANLEIET